MLSDDLPWRWKEAEEDATLALTLAPGEVKAYFRRSTARKELDDFAGARAGELIPYLMHLGYLTEHPKICTRSAVAEVIASKRRKWLP